MTTSPRIDLDRLLRWLDTFNQIGALPGGGNCRLALTDEDRAGRDLLVRWMHELGLIVTVDAIGNIVGVRSGREDLPPVMFGSVSSSALSLCNATRSGAILIFSSSTYTPA